VLFPILHWYLVGGGTITGFNFITDNNYQNGGGKRIWALDWNPNDNYVASGSEQSNNQELVIYYFDGSTLTTTKTVEEGVQINSVNWHPTKNFLAVGENSGANPEFQVYNFNVSNGSLTLTGSGEYGSTDAMAVAWHSSGNFVEVGTDSKTSKQIISYAVNNSTGAVTEKFSVSLSGKQAVGLGAMRFSPGGNLLAVGVASDGAKDPELLVYSFNNGILALNSSFAVGTSVLNLDWSPTGTYIAVGTGNNPQLRIYAHHAASNTITLVTSVTAATVNAVAWDQTGQYLAVGYEGVPGPHIRVYFFDKSHGTLTDVGTLPAPNTDDNYGVRFSHNNSYLAAGDHSSDTIIYGVQGGMSHFLLFDNTKVIFNSDVIFNLPVHFRGNCVITGRGNGLSIVDGGGVVIHPDSTLTLEDMEFQNLEHTNLRCLTDSASLVLKNALLTLSSDYTFSRGSILFDADTTISGTNAFIYTSNVGSTIDSNSSLIIDQGVTFSYAPMGPYRNLVFMPDPTAILYLDGCTLVSTRTGLQLSGGTLAIDNAVTMSSQARFYAEGISLKSDLTVDLLGSANLQFYGIIRTD